MTQTWKMLAAMGIATTIMTSPVAMNGQNVQVAQAATTTSITYMGQIDDPKTAIYHFFAEYPSLKERSE